MKAITLSGSIRKGSYNQMLARHVGLKLRDAGGDVTDIDLGKFTLPIFIEDLEKGSAPEAAMQLAKMFREADIIFIASPEYNGGMTPLLVNTLTWVSRQKPSPFQNAVFGIGGVSSGNYGAIWSLAHLRDTLSKVGCLVAPGLLGVGPASSAFDENGAPTESSVQRKVDQLIMALTRIKRG